MFPLVMFVSLASAIAVVHETKVLFTTTQLDVPYKSIPVAQNSNSLPEIMDAPGVLPR